MVEWLSPLKPATPASSDGGDWPSSMLDSELDRQDELGESAFAGTTPTMPEPLEPERGVVDGAAIRTVGSTLATVRIGVSLMPADDRGTESSVTNAVNTLDTTET